MSGCAQRRLESGRSESFVLVIQQLESCSTSASSNAAIRHRSRSMISWRDVRRANGMVPPGASSTLEFDRPPPVAPRCLSYNGIHGSPDRAELCRTPGRPSCRSSGRCGRPFPVAVSRRPSSRGCSRRRRAAGSSTGTCRGSSQPCRRRRSSPCTSPWPATWAR